MVQWRLFYSEKRVLAVRGNTEVVCLCLPSVFFSQSVHFWGPLSEMEGDVSQATVLFWRAVWRAVGSLPNEQTTNRCPHHHGVDTVCFVGCVWPSTPGNPAGCFAWPTASKVSLLFFERSQHVFVYAHYLLAHFCTNGAYSWFKFQQ